MIDITPKNGKKQLKITEMYVFVSVDEDGEGVIAASTHGGMLMPLVGADLDRVRSLIPVADNVCEQSGKAYKILKFSAREDITKKFKK